LGIARGLRCAVGVLLGWRGELCLASAREQIPDLLLDVARRIPCRSSADMDKKRGRKQCQWVGEKLREAR
jgi:hypothetical protein